jgi:hypothetical protein
MNTFIAVAVLSIVPVDNVIEDSADVVELNSYYDEYGDLVFDQVIFWNWNGFEHRVFAWKLLKSNHQIPIKSSGVLVAIWKDQDKIRKIVTKSLRRTWTQYDPELLDREKLSQCRRTGFSRR